MVDEIDTIVKTVTTRNDASVGVRTTDKPNMSTIDLHDKKNNNKDETCENVLSSFHNYYNYIIRTNINLIGCQWALDFHTDMKIKCLNL